MKPADTLIILVSHTYPPVLGGSEIEAQRVLAALVQRGYQALVLCAGGGPMPQPGPWVDSAGIPVRILTPQRYGTWTAIRFTLNVAWNLWRERRSKGIVYFLMPGLHLAFNLPIAVLLGKRVLMKFSGSNTIRPLASSWAGRLELRWLRRLRIPVLLLNEGMVDEAESVGIPRAQTSFMPNPVDVRLFSPAPPDEKRRIREQLGISPDTGLLLYTGRLSQEKGVAVLVEGLAAALRSISNLQLALVGDGPYRAELEALVFRLSLPANTIRFVGRVAPDAVPLWLQAADAFALVSPNEGFSCALSEAMACGLPSVVSDIPANTQLVKDGVHGLTVPVGDTEATGAAIARLFGDEELRGQMGGAARTEIVEKYSIAKVVDLYETLFREMQGEQRVEMPS